MLGAQSMHSSADTRGCLAAGGGSGGSVHGGGGDHPAFSSTSGASSSEVRPSVDEFSFVLLVDRHAVKTARLLWPFLCFDHSVLTGYVH